MTYKTNVFLLFAFLLAFSSCNKAPKPIPGIYINEFLASNSGLQVDPVDKEHSDWIEIYNAYDSIVDISGYYLTDDLDEIKKWSFPQGSVIEAYGFLIVWANGKDTTNHSNFRLSKSGGQIILSDRSEFEVDRVDYNLQALNISYGRKWDGIDLWNYYDESSFNLTNDSINGVYKVSYASKPSFTKAGGFYDSPISIELLKESADIEIRYTLDGNIPNRKSKKYKKPIQIESTTVIRAACFEKGKLRSPILTKTYFINVDKSLPVISLVSDDKSLWDKENGIYENSFRRIERMANVEYFEDKKPIINQEIDIRISGNYARHHGQKAMVLEAKSKYGEEAFQHRFFPSKRMYSSKSILLRVGGHPDKYNSMFLDAYGQKLTEEHVDIDHAGYRPAVLYLNGEYWGLYNIREKVNNNFIVDNHRIPKDKFDFLQNSWAIVNNGTNKHYYEVVDFIVDSDKKNKSDYNYIKSQFDLDNYIDYQIIELYAANIDWPSWNIKYWREKEEYERWKWVLIDLDYAFGTGAKVDFNMLEYALSPVETRITNRPLATKLFRNLIQFEEFRNEFIQRFAASLNEIYSPVRAKRILDECIEERREETTFQIERWSYFIYNSPWGEFSMVNSMEEWEEKNESIKDFLLKRPDIMRQHLKDYFDAGEIVEVETQSRYGSIIINTIKLDHEYEKGLFFSSIPLRIEATPNAGFKLDHWEVNGKSIKRSKLTHKPKEGDLVKAIFKRISSSILPETITKDTILREDNSPYYVTKDLTVEKGATLTIEKGVDLYMDEFTSIIIKGGFKVTGKYFEPINILPNPENHSKEWGALCIDNAESKIKIKHLNLIKSSWYEDKNKYKASITSYNSDVSLEYVSVESADFPFYSEYGSVSIRHSTFFSPKTCDMVNIKYADKALVENCIFPGNYYPDTDAIDFDRINNGVIRGNTIYGFFGFNSDAIDIGETSSEILIEGNKIYNMSDKGISVGQGSSAIVKNNLIYGCVMGIGIKDNNSYADISNTTFIGNKNAIATFEKNENYGGGSAVISNCIFYGSRKKDVFVDENSKVDISYSMSNKKVLEGYKNIEADPEYNDLKILDLTLNDSSPALDEDSEIIMGSDLSNTQTKTNKIDINKVIHNFENPERPFVWIEIQNNSAEDIDLTHYTIQNENYYSYPLPSRYILKKGEKLILSNDRNRYRFIHGKALDVRECLGKKLISKGEVIRIYDGQMNLVKEHLRKNAKTESLSSTN